MLKDSYWKENNNSPYERRWELFHYSPSLRITRILATIREGLRFNDNTVYYVDIFNVYYLDEGLIKNSDGFFKEYDLDVAKFKSEVLGAQILKNMKLY